MWGLHGTGHVAQFQHVLNLFVGNITYIFNNLLENEQSQSLGTAATALRQLCSPYRLNHVPSRMLCSRSILVCYDEASHNKQARPADNNESSRPNSIGDDGADDGEAHFNIKYPHQVLWASDTFSSIRRRQQKVFWYFLTDFHSYTLTHCSR